MQYDSHPLSNHLTQTLDLLLDHVNLNPKKVSSFNLFDLDHSIPVVNDLFNGSSQSGQPFKNPPMAFQSVMKDLGSLPRNRSYIYDLIYSLSNDSVDIGSGSFSKGLESYKYLSYYNGPARLLLDIKDPEIFPLYDTMDINKINFKSFDMNDLEDQKFFEHFMQSHPGFLVTAVNSLMYKKIDLKPFNDHDMLYTLPDPHAMLQQGKIVMLDARKYRFVISKEEEYSHGEQLDSEPGEMQSLAINLANRIIKVSPLDKVEMEKMEEDNLYFDLCRRPVRLSRTTKGTLVGPFFKKIDGITMVMAKRGEFLYTKTAFDFEIYKVNKLEEKRPFDDFEIEGEFIQDANVLILHSVYSLGLFKLPAFMKKIEHEFVNKYHIEGLPFKLYSKKAYETIDHCLLDEEEFGNYTVTVAEGVLGFVEGKRYMVAGKMMESLDITPEMARDLQIDFQDNYDQELHVVNLDGGICEYVLFRSEEVIYLKALKYRLDKTSPNSYERCVRMIMDLMLSQTHDLADYVGDDTLAIYGMTRNS